MLSNTTKVIMENATENKANLIANFKRHWPVEKWIEIGYFTEECISNINVHWLRFLPPDPARFYILGVLYVVITAVGVTGNFLVIFLFIRCRSLRTPANTLIINLAVSDGIMILKSVIFIFNCFCLGPALGDLACQIYAFLGGLTGTVTIATLSVISFDRYFVIKYPLNRISSDLRIKVCLGITWIYGLVFAVIPALDVGFGKYSYEGYLTSCSFDYLADDAKVRIFIFVFFVFAWLIPFCLITFSYASILCLVLRRPGSQDKDQDSYRHVKDDEDKKQEVKLAFVVLSTILLWFVSWTPYATVALLGISNRKDLISPLVSMIPAVFCKTASCVNSYVYALSHPKFRNELKKLCCPTRRNANRPKMPAKFDTEPSVEEEFIEVDAREFSSTKTESFSTCETEYERQVTMVEMLCLKPSFKNERSSLRKLARRFSRKEKRSTEMGDEVNVTDF